MPEEAEVLPTSSSMAIGEEAPFLLVIIVREPETLEVGDQVDN